MKNFIDETRENLEEMNTIMRSTSSLLEDFTKDLEKIFLKLIQKT